MICRMGSVKGGDLFNMYHQWWCRASRESVGKIDVTIPIRFRGFGNEKEKQAAWDRDWRSRFPSWGPVSQVTVSSDPPEIWFDLRETDEGLFLPPHIVGHEPIHVVKLKMNSVIDPDTFAGRSV